MRKTNIDFCKNSKWFVLCIAIVYVVTIAMIFISGIGVDIKFTGGALLKYSYTGGEVELSKIEDIAETTLGRDVTVQQNTDALGNKTLVISVADRGGKAAEDAEPATDDAPVANEAPLLGAEAPVNDSTDSVFTDVQSESTDIESEKAANTAEADIYAVNIEEEAALIAAIEEAYPDVQFENAGSNSVSAAMGKETLIKSLIAVLIAVGLVLVYIAIRFRKIGGWRAGFCAVVSLLVSLSFVFAAFIIMGSSLSENFIAVLLTILGYAINDTIIVYDRIRENKAKLGRGRIDYAALVNESENQTLTRTINTTITTALAIGTVAVMSVIFNIESIISFAFPMLVGIIVGTFSTLFISGPLWVKLQKKQ